MPEHHVILNERGGRLVFCLCHERGTSVGAFTVGKAEEIPTTALRFAPSAKGETRGCRKERRMLRLQSGQRTDDVLSDQSARSRLCTSWPQACYLLQVDGNEQGNSTVAAAQYNDDLRLERSDGQRLAYAM